MRDGPDSIVPQRYQLKPTHSVGGTSAVFTKNQSGTVPIIFFGQKVRHQYGAGVDGEILAVEVNHDALPFYTKQIAIQELKT